MALGSEKFERSIRACLANGRRLLEDAEWSANQSSTGLALALLAQEESAKAFVLALVRDEIVPWTDEVRRSLSVHECKHLVTIVMEWLWTVSERRLNELPARPTSTEGSGHLPPDVATAMNIYRHEMIERIGRRYAERYSDWRGRARKVADGQRDRKKQAALYVGIREDGDVESLPTSQDGFDEEIARAKALLDFAAHGYLFARSEYESFAETFKAMFRDLVSGPEERAASEEEMPSGIPGVRFVRRTITVANVVSPDVADETALEN